MRFARSAGSAILWGLSLSFLLLSCESVKVEGPTGPGGGGGGQVTVSSVTVSPSSFTISPGSTQQLSATVRGSDGSTITNKTVTWTTSSGTVATVSGTGLVTAVGAGTAIITATVEGVSGSSSGTVGNPAPTVVSLSPPSGNYGQVGFTLTITGTGFVTSSVVRVDGADRATTYLSATQLQAPIQATDLEFIGNLEVTVYNPAPGGGTSQAAVLEVGICSQGGIEFGQRVAGTLVSSDCLFDDDTHFHSWEFQASQGQFYQAALASESFDSFVGVWDPGLEVVATDDDDGVDVNSRLTFMATTSGVHRVYVSTWDAGETGYYELRVSQVTPLELGVYYGGQIPVGREGTGGEAHPDGPARVEGVPADRFAFPVVSGMGVMAEARAGINSGIDAAMEMFEVAEDPLGGNYQNDPFSDGGEIVVGVSEDEQWGSLDLYGGFGSTGAYELLVQQCRVFVLTLGATVGGSTSVADDCALFGEGGATAVLIGFPGEGGLPIDLYAASEWDNFLLLFGPAGNLIAVDDDSGGDLNARITMVLPDDGIYLALLGSINFETAGPFAVGLGIWSGSPPQAVAPPAKDPASEEISRLLENTRIRALGTAPRESGAERPEKEGGTTDKAVAKGQPRIRGGGF